MEYLVAVADAGSFRRAAARLYISQPSLSQQIRALEAEVGVPLLDRPPKPVRLTAAGRAFAVEARATLTCADRALRAARLATALEAETLEVATVESLAISALPTCLRRWRAVRPTVVTNLREFPHRHQLEQAVRQHADLGVGPTPRDWTGAYHGLGWDELVAVLPPGDALLESERPARLEEMADRAWVLFSDNHGLAANVRLACATSGFEPQPAVRTHQVEAACRLAASGLGPTIVPRRNVPRELGALVRPLAPAVGWEVGAFASAPRFGEMAKSFVGVLAEGDWQAELPAGAQVLGPD